MNDRRSTPAGDGAASGTNGLSFDDLTYEQLVASLEELAERMASGSIGIEEAAELYEMAGRLHAAAAARLAAVEQRIEGLRTETDT
jgi:exodeoxyribonuclease VII small subunit